MKLHVDYRTQSRVGILTRICRTAQDLRSSCADTHLGNCDSSRCAIATFNGHFSPARHTRCNREWHTTAGYYHHSRTNSQSWLLNYFPTLECAAVSKDTDGGENSKLGFRRESPKVRRRFPSCNQWSMGFRRGLVLAARRRRRNLSDGFRRDFWRKLWTSRKLIFAVESKSYADPVAETGFLKVGPYK